MANNKQEKKTKSVAELIEDACEILANSKSFFKIVISGKKTSIKIEKPKENEI